MGSAVDVKLVGAVPFQHQSLPSLQQIIPFTPHPTDLTPGASVLDGTVPG